MTGGIFAPTNDLPLFNAFLAREAVAFLLAYTAYLPARTDIRAGICLF